MNFDQIKAYKVRQFVGKDAALADAQTVVAYYKKLIDEQVDSAESFEEWLIKYSELGAALSQKGAILYIYMACQTDDESCSEKYKDFIENIVPHIKTLEDVLNKKILELAQSYDLDEERYNVYFRNIRADQEIFVKENVVLETKLELLSQKYQTIIGAMMVEFEGEERTLPQMAKYLREPDRVIREAAWMALTKRRLKDKDALNEIFNEMIALRRKIALNAGFDGYCKFRFKELHRFDYLPDDCKEYHEVIEKLVVPILAQIYAERKLQMGLSKLRPWDTSVDPKGRAALKPFNEIEKLPKGCESIFRSVDPELGEKFVSMHEQGLLDMESRKGKAPGGFMSTLDEARRPFIFMNAVGVDQDVRTLLHEGGHAFHSMLSAHEKIVDYRHAPMEFCEVASMSMELIAYDHLSTFYSEEDIDRSNKRHLEDVIVTLVWVALIDLFQHWIYENPEHTVEEREQAWLGFRKRFGCDLIDWSDLNEQHINMWHAQLHIFEVPFYYIEYGIAQIGALQLWKRYKQDPEKAIDGYKKGLSLGGSRPLPELFETAGIKFDFSETTIRPLVEMVKKELNLKG
ncbi:MAG: M3 family oligoendopeptidase [Candidatus Omnitrophica bacterium]|nr:M3 family oligoendopeptidase [Candidatus Omnitrophota bacterium]MBU1997488.1 M3 family oligoendopeptidase [Candidatus Omnitrophota bacterium]MBU4334534.1 M3 family oligoendopeptidase [Candidatus Omnitrophota bacterium]